MARAKSDLLSRLADAGEDAISRLSDAPGMDRIASFATTTRDRLDELTKRVRGIEGLEERIKRLEKRVDELSGKKSPARKTTRKTAAPKKTRGASPG